MTKIGNSLTNWRPIVRQGLVSRDDPSGLAGGAVRSLCEAVGRQEGCLQIWRGALFGNLGCNVCVALRPKTAGATPTSHPRGHRGLMAPLGPSLSASLRPPTNAITISASQRTEARPATTTQLTDPRGRLMHDDKRTALLSRETTTHKHGRQDRWSLFISNRHSDGSHPGSRHYLGDHSGLSN